MINLKISSLDMERIFLYTKLADGEISGLGEIEWDNDQPRVSKLCPLMKQKCSGADTEIDWQAASELFGSSECPEKIRFSWHSHVNMGVFMSGTDTANVESYGKVGAQYLFSLVVNKKREMCMQYDVFKPIHMTTKDVKMDIQYETDKKLLAAITAEVAEKVEKPAPVIHVGGEKWVRDEHGLFKQEEQEYTLEDYVKEKKQAKESLESNPLGPFGFSENLSNFQRPKGVSRKTWKQWLKGEFNNLTE